ncbi:HesB/YadR/YfhF family protein [Lentibacillus sp. Marseille-P4043]|uniref:HesB/YadR/YfhF family protein n=1 Tax=Lentibacillus sp. Marseille-P4043 TaxID=2040293 RepID=UPI000D0AE97B|nr:HesB/YadR/YfhF family protein [Lentibacillus sp. Marseille-P4043]
MKLHVTEEVAEWYKEELDIDDTNQLRFYVRYGGSGGRIPGFSLGVRVDSPYEAFITCKAGGLTFFIEAKDAWYFDDNNLYVRLNQNKDEPEFVYD